jgi:phosphoglycerate dehydrogenase-like enzyme
MKILLMYSTHQPRSDHIKRLQSKDPDIVVVVADSERKAIEEAPSTDVIFGHRYLRQCLPHASRLQWVQISSAGIDRLKGPELFKRPILLTKTTVLGPFVARHAHTMAWALVRRIPDFLNRQSRGVWDRHLEMLPFPKVAMILGFGSIGRELGKLFKGDGLQVWGVKRHGDEASRAFCDRLLGVNSWRMLLPEIDLCLLTLPLNASTKGIFDENALRALPSHAVLVNVGRAETLDIQASIRVLQEGRLGGVGLDVVSPEPPSPDDPFWKTPRLLLTPHIAAHCPERPQLLEAFFEQQLARYLAGEPLEGVVNPFDLEI